MRLSLWRGEAHVCSYLEGQTARLVFVDPRQALQGPQINLLIQNGFRRSGAHYYRPDCEGCRACVPLRIPTRDFKPSRSQKRTWARHAALEVKWREPVFEESHYRLYLRYQSARHPGGTMAESSAEEYLAFLSPARGERTWFCEFRRAGRLMALAVVDCLDDGASAVYTFYEPGPSGQGLGTFAVLWQLDWLKAQGLPYLYLGYWVAASQKMAYKAQFRPFECYLGGLWRRAECDAAEGTAECPASGEASPEGSSPSGLGIC